MYSQLCKIKKYGLNKSLSIIIDRMRLSFYKQLVKYSPVWNDPNEIELNSIENKLESRGINLCELIIEKDEFEQFKSDFVFGDSFYGGPKTPIFNEKILEHFISFKLSVENRFNGDDVYIDIAAADSPWVMLLRKKGYKSYAIDLNRSPSYGHLEYYKIMDATNTSFPAESIRSASFHCAYEMFNTDTDIKVIYELNRILTKGGRAIIVPLYMNTIYSGYSSPEYYLKKRFHDDGAKVYVTHSHRNIPFARFYDVERFEERVLYTIRKNALQYNLYALKNSNDIDANIYCRFVLEIMKPHG